MNGLTAMASTYLVFVVVLLVGYMFPNRRTAGAVKLAFALMFVVVVLTIIWYGALMTFYYFNGGVVSR